MTLDRAIQIGLNPRRHSVSEVRAAYDTLLTSEDFLRRDVCAATGNCEGFLRREEARA